MKVAKTYTEEQVRDTMKIVGVVGKFPETKREDMTNVVTAYAEGMAAGMRFAGQSATEESERLRR